MIAFGASNFRRFRNTGLVELRPVTLLVGRNSSGKSSFLRAFPLLKQSLMTRTRSPVLWWGDFVDFGSFEGAVHQNDQGSSIVFNFAVQKLLLERQYLYYYQYGPHPAQRTHELSDVKVALYIKRHGSTERLSQIDLEVGQTGDQATLVFSETDQLERIEINGRPDAHVLSDFVVQVEHGSIFPDITLTPVRNDRELDPLLLVRTLFSESMEFFLGDNLHGRTSKRSIGRLAHMIRSIWPLAPDRLAQLSPENAKTSWQKFLREINSPQGGGKLLDLNRLAFSMNVFEILSSSFRYMSETVSRTLYMGPARARSERYYRYQDLAVSEIDPDGKNFPMFLNSLSPEQMTNLSGWISSLFKYEVSIDRQAGHISINISAGHSTTNIVDTGYGLSQLLPVLAQMWWATDRPVDAPGRSRGSRRQSATAAPSVLAIEQPELHLHPAHQGLLADALVGAHQKALKGYQNGTGHKLLCIVETHSETLVNKLGELIAERAVSPDDVQILIFEALEDDDRGTRISVSEFDSDGVLKNWPYGFFQS